MKLRIITILCQFLFLANTYAFDIQNESKMLSEANITKEDLQQIKIILGKKKEYYIIAMGRNSLNLVEVNMGEKSKGKNPSSGPVFFLYKEKQKWFLHNEMSEWFNK